MKDSTILITGGAGFIGANFVKYLMREYRGDIKLIVLDKLAFSGSVKTLEEETDAIDLTKGDICDKEVLEDIFSNNDIDHVVNFAAESHVDRSIEDPESFLHANILGLSNLLSIAKVNWLLKDNSYKDDKRFLQISTDEVYGSLSEEGLFTENCPLAPSSPYAASKAGGDMLVRSYVETYDFPAIITRCSNNYGPYQFPEKFIPLIIKNALEYKKIPIYGDGKNVRDWLYVEDHCKAIDLAIKKGRPKEVYNIGGRNERQNITVAKKIIDIIKRRTGDDNIGHDLLEFVQDRKGHDRRYAIDPTKIRRELGWRTETDFEKGIERTVDWYLQNRKWLKEVSSGKYRTYSERVSREK